MAAKEVDTTTRNQEQTIQLKLTIKEIFSVLCEDCKGKLLTLATDAVANDSINTIKSQLRKDWENSQ